MDMSEQNKCSANYRTLEDTFIYTYYKWYKLIFSSLQNISNVWKWLIGIHEYNTSEYEKRINEIVTN